MQRNLKRHQKIKMSSTRIDILNGIIDLHIECLQHKDDPILSDTKILTEILKAILVLEQIKNIEGKRSENDDLSQEELEEKMDSIGLS